VIYRFCRFAVWLVYKIVWRLSVHGKENIPASGGFIMAANHRSYADPPLVGVAMKRPVHFMAKRELFSFKPFGWLIHNLNAHPLDRSRSVEAIRLAQSLLKAGEAVIVFPEGGRNKTDQLKPAKPGIGLLSVTTGKPVLPAYLHNSEAEAMKRLKPLSVTFGRPIDPAGYESYQALADAVMAEIQRLKNMVLSRHSSSKELP
jgi:1-acyl-sn-glycerol-3-phosphate acyltransferase